jgi:hypothetical protein
MRGLAVCSMVNKHNSGLNGLVRLAVSADTNDPLLARGPQQRCVSVSLLWYLTHRAYIAQLW